MKILFYAYPDNAEVWMRSLESHLSGAQIRFWQPGDEAAADHLVVRNPPSELLTDRPGLRAVFNLGAGVDGLMQALQHPAATLPAHVPLIRLDDAGMASQMVDYVVHAVLHHHRHFEAYAASRAQGAWQVLPAPDKAAFEVGVLGLGLLGTEVAKALSALGFKVRGWSRKAKADSVVPCQAGASGMAPFLQGLNCLINLLPLTVDTENVLNKVLFAQLARGAYLINVARGGHLVEADLLEAVGTGQLSGARLDVFRTEPLPAEHSFWNEPRISMTPHISAVNLVEPSMRQIAGKIRALAQGQAVAGVVDRQRGY
ncbi:MAG: glyoxylate/hydroxypyruvate reductase A [Pseudomonadota bacterium]